MCLFEQANVGLLLVGYDKGDTGYSFSSLFAGAGAETVSDEEHWAIAGPLHQGEHIREASLADGTQLVVSQTRGGWMTIVEPVDEPTTVAVVFQRPDGIGKQIFKVGFPPDSREPLEP